MPSRLWLRRFFTLSGLALLSVACAENAPVEPAPPSEAPPAELIVSDPFLPSQPNSVADESAPASSLTSVAEAEITYVSLPAGSLPNARSVTIRNVTAGAAQSPLITVVDGGFDPVLIVAKAGDELEIRMTVVGGATTVYRTVVPRRRPPGVVRTNPPKGMLDVPLNSRVLVVFTEPVAPATVTTATVQLLQGSTPVPGTVRLVAGALFAAEFVPDRDLASGTTYRLVVTQGVLDDDGDALEAEVTTEFATVTTVTSILAASIVAGALHTCALSADGSVACWGANFAGQLGTGNQVRAFGSCPWEYVPGTYNPFPCSSAPAAVVGAHKFASLTLGLMHTCALMTTGEAFCWGNDPNAELGTDEAISSCNVNNPGPPSAPDKCSGLPLRVGGGLKFSSLVAGTWHTCGLRVDGAAYCWGFGFDGALGTGNAGVVTSPAAVLGGHNFSSITSGATHTCGLTQDGIAYCWGLDEARQLGVGGVSPARCNFDKTSSVVPCAKVPVRVSGGLTFASIAAGFYHTCALTTTGRAYCWGTMAVVFDPAADGYVPSAAGAFGPAPALVDNDLVFVSLSSSPTAAHTCGVTAASVAYCWGENESGQLGNGFTTNTLVPVRVAGGLAFSQVAAGGAHSCGITTASIYRAPRKSLLYCWGDNFSGQLGVGNNASAGSLLPIRVSGQ